MFHVKHRYFFKYLRIKKIVVHLYKNYLKRNSMQKTEKLHGHEIESVEEIAISGTFESVNEAIRILKERGYEIGSMSAQQPIGFAKGYDYISKWYNLNKSDIKKLDGVLISNDFREGSVKIVTFKK